MTTNANSIAQTLQNNKSLCNDELYLSLSQCTLRIRSNSDLLIAKLKDYFAPVVTNTVQPDIDIIAIERKAPELGMKFVDWKREPGKTGRKDAYIDLSDGRVILKVRTGMLFLQSGQYKVAAGPCIENDNQIINFINAQYMNWLQNRGWLICHAAGLVYQGRGFAIAGFSGGGKSTLMLKLLDHKDIAYLTNDRLFIRDKSDTTQTVGIPKLPRINPGTIVHNPSLHCLIPASERQALLQLEPKALWELEDKYDVHVEQVYGKGKIITTEQTPLQVFLVLNWQRNSDQPLEVEPVNLAERRDLLGAIMKSPGPFYQYPDGSFYMDNTKLNEQAYLDALNGVSIYEAKGTVDFEALSDHFLNKLLDK